MQVELFKQKGKPYTDKEGKERTPINYYVKCNSKLIPIKVANFSTQDKKDTQYAGRCSVLDTFADILPDKQS